MIINNSAKKKSQIRLSRYAYLSISRDLWEAIDEPEKVVIEIVDNVIKIWGGDDGLKLIRGKNNLWLVNSRLIGFGDKLYQGRVEGNKIIGEVKDE